VMCRVVMGCDVTQQARNMRSKQASKTARKKAKKPENTTTTTTETRKQHNNSNRLCEYGY